MKKQHLLPLALLAATLPLQAQVNIGIDAQNRGPKISPSHYGIFFEDINHAAADGMDENTLQTPTNIYPTEQQLSPEADGRVLLDIPAYSLNIIRIRQ